MGEVCIVMVWNHYMRWNQYVISRFPATCFVVAIPGALFLVGQPTDSCLSRVG